MHKLSTALVASLFVSTAHASTVVPFSPMTVDLLDPTGHGCTDIRLDDFDTPFGGKVSGSKGMLLPILCLPDPCAGAITKDKLSQMKGAKIEQWEWDAYYSRYAELCRSETVPFTEGKPADVDAMTGREGVDTFWEPILDDTDVVADAFGPAGIFSSLTGGSYAGGSSAGGTSSGSTGGGSSGGGSSFGTPIVSFDDEEDGGTLTSGLIDPDPVTPDPVTPVTAPLAAVPLPASGLLMALSFLFCGFISRKKA